ncbi:HisA/HisF-related TIM barrel protein [Rhodopirellula baltica]|uniref:HisA/hisF family protein n=1 Tax=Rhodopirellula baltica WH47 TaxID=991778 RepID=F2AVU1_RHOBT|nr:HisA/HisF-related TIM barrel protein [Rhodopirellula baltica]EGF26290.1 hisA/hisF family protein [Rhodopirellula baltica WH47]
MSTPRTPLSQRLTSLSQQLHEQWKPVLDRLIGVIDLKDGVAVHGIAGNRSQYQPIAGLSADECSLLHWYRSIGIRRFYVADLNGLMGTGRQRDALLALVTEIRQEETLWIDSGWTGSVSRIDQEWLSRMNRSIANESNLRWIIATETADSLDVQDRMLEFVNSSNLTLSLDYRAGQFVGPETATDWVLAALKRNIREGILLDVASVGSESGPASGEMFSDCVSRFGDMSWITGGGIRNVKDVRGLVSEGYSAFLIASAMLPALGTGRTPENS